MFLEAVILGLLVGKLRGGRVQSIGNLEFKGWLLMVVLFLIQTLPMVLGRMSWMAHRGHIIAFSTMVLLLAIVVMNLDKRGFWLVALGALLNILAMVFNGFRMPVYITALQESGRTELVESVVNGAVLNYFPVEVFGNWSAYLGKIIALPSGYPIAQMLSVGDVLISLGFFIFVVGQMTASHYFRTKGRMMDTFYPTR